jgi:hypothetical protein
MAFVKATHDQIVTAARAWMAAARREWVKRNPDELCPLPIWDGLSAVERQAFMACIEAALNAADPENVKKVMERDAQNPVP